MNDGKQTGIHLPASWEADWVVDRALGSGAFSTVYRIVRRDRPTIDAALKVISIPQNEAEASSLLAEGMDSSQSQNYYDAIAREYTSEIDLMEDLKGAPNIVGIEDYKVVRKTNGIGNDIYIRMELLKPLDSVLRERRLTEQEVIRLGIDVCNALDLCEEKHIIHRDIKPANIFVNDKTSRHVFYKLGDFGVARNLESMTQGLSKKGTPNYMAPEVVIGRNYDHRADIYSLGITLYRLLNGNRLPLMPTEDLTPATRENAIARRLSGEKLPPPEYADGNLARIVLKACEYRPEDRYTSAREMKRELEALLKYDTESSTVEDDQDKTVFIIPDERSRPEEKRAATQKKRVLISAVIACTCLVLTGIAFFVVQGGKQSNNQSSATNTETVIPQKATENPTIVPDAQMTVKSTIVAAIEITATPTEVITETPTVTPTATPSTEPTATPTAEPTPTPTAELTETPTATPTAAPTATPTAAPTTTPTVEPTEAPMTDQAADMALTLMSESVTEETEQTVWSVGNVVTFGRYEQDNDLSNGTEEIEWVVLDNRDGKALLLSRYGLDAKPYNTVQKSVTWEECTLREWLNNEFLKEAFASSERHAILLTDVDNSEDQGFSGWKTGGEENTRDYVFLLSYAEVNQYFKVTGNDAKNVKSRMSPTAYAKKNGAQSGNSNKTEEGEGTGWWWLRSPGANKGTSAFIRNSGSLSYINVRNNEGCVRPAVWINLHPDDSENDASGTFLSESEEFSEENVQESQQKMLQEEATIPSDENSGTSFSDWKTAYYQYLIGNGFRSQENRNTAGKVYYTDWFGCYYDPEIMESSGTVYKICFALYDWDQDGIPELFAYNGSKSKIGAYYVFTYRNGEMICLGIAGQGWPGLYPYRDDAYNVLFSTIQDGAYTQIIYATMNDNGTIQEEMLAATEKEYGSENRMCIVEEPVDDKLYLIYVTQAEKDNLISLSFKGLNDNSNLNDDWWNDFVANYAYIYPVVRADNAIASVQTENSELNSSPKDSFAAVNFSSILFYARTSKETRIREEASKNSRHVKTVGEGKEAAVLEETIGDDGITWYRVQFQDGTIGYARCDFFVKTEKPVSNDGSLYGLTTQKLATRSGPSTQYDETGTYFVKGQYIKVICRAYDSLTGIWWVKCEIPYHGEIRVLWTGYSRFDSDTLPLDSIPIGN